MDIQDERKQNTPVSRGGFFKKLKGIKNLQIIVVIFIIAVALIIYSTVMTRGSSASEQTSSNSVMTADEQRLSAILSNIEGAGEVDAMITVDDGKIAGVLVIADGADSITVRLRLIDATATALGISKNIVNVFCRK
ncbi:MAG: hypothetical protein NC037_05780 [Bacteroides sp.]|nr:hypothetical protein [Bacillota bacterium]MCM1394289.1 hypothetical protein [[Eubacterium] siraeum]MCM1456015.1 hypothetical protein [Bacteroides sp.]